MDGDEEDGGFNGMGEAKGSQHGLDEMRCAKFTTDEYSMPVRIVMQISLSFGFTKIFHRQVQSKASAVQSGN